jgi:hypothetical protein
MLVLRPEFKPFKGNWACCEDIAEPLGFRGLQFVVCSLQSALSVPVVSRKWKGLVEDKERAQRLDGNY